VYKGTMPDKDLIVGLNSTETALVAAAESLVPALRDTAEQSDIDGGLPEQNIAALRDAGLLRMSVPPAYGGHAIGMRALLGVASELGRGCSSTAWVASLFYNGGIACGFFGDAVRDVIWGNNPDAMLCGSVGVAHPAVSVDGGYLVSGQWRWLSGVNHADWVGVEVAHDTGRAMVVVPKSDLTVLDTWHMAGMRGTGSHSVVAENVFVPTDQMLSFAKLAAGGYRRPEADEVLTRVPFPLSLPVALIGSVLGMGMAVYEYTVGVLRDGRPITSAGRPMYQLAIESPGFQTNVAKAAILIDSAVLQAGRAADDIDRAARTSTPPDAVAAARVRMDVSFAARQIRKAVDMLLDVGGASRFDTSNPVQRIWRDLGTVTRHPAFGSELNTDVYGRLLLGLETA
jgi:3-hydroxy-9,10-secoandrosta-1,3,5(10)-triene-9,17-dione monooxygenase